MVYSIFYFIVGAACGSFSLVLAWRMHDKRDWIMGRSACDKCGHELSPTDLIPVISWVALRGKCRYCKKHLPRTLVASEILLGSVFAYSWLSWSIDHNYLVLGSQLTIWLFSSVILSALFWYDYRWYKLPTKLIRPLTALAVIYSFTRLGIDGYSSVNDIVWPVLSASLLTGLFAAIFFVSRGKWIGFGDVRLAVPLGLFLGSPLNAWLMLFLASILGILFALPSLSKGNRKLTSKIPFGPLLIIGTWIVVIAGQEIVNFYVDLMGL